MSGGPWLFLNPRHGVPGVTVLSAAGFARAGKAIRVWDGYRPTPLLDLPLSGTVRIKDESSRFGLGSFKALGGGYAVREVLASQLARLGVTMDATTEDLASGRFGDVTRSITVTAATDGNHGRAVAWAASHFHCKCVIYIHATVSPGRAAAIAAYGAEVRRVPGIYDDAVRVCDQDAAAGGFHVVSDTSWPGYTEVPRTIMQGYRMMAEEAVDQWRGPPPTHIFIQAGVGGAAAAVSAHVRARWGIGPRLIVVEPDRAACLMASARAGKPVAVEGDLNTIMAGLACGEPSLLAWLELERAAAAFLTIPDQAAIDAMRALAGHGIVAGESGAAGFAGYRRAMDDPGARSALGLETESRILTFSTEGATDPDLYAALTAGI